MIETNENNCELLLLLKSVLILKKFNSKNRVTNFSYNVNLRKESQRVFGLSVFLLITKSKNL